MGTRLVFAVTLLLALAPCLGRAAIISVETTAMAQPTNLAGSVDWALWGGESSSLEAFARQTESAQHPLSYTLVTDGGEVIPSTWAAFYRTTTNYSAGLGSTALGVNLPAPLGDFAGYDQFLRLWLWCPAGTGSVTFYNGANEVGPISLGTDPVAVTLRFSGPDAAAGLAYGGGNTVSIGGAAYGYVAAVPEPVVPLVGVMALPLAALCLRQRNRKG